ncbi:hypothetical protein GJ496_011144 [Pomphorhynchus laevis]|nr:hypothetical protein GJ496_011144 [Pomphorhynchus laevis]
MRVPPSRLVLDNARYWKPIVTNNDENNLTEEITNEDEENKFCGEVNDHSLKENSLPEKYDIISVKRTSIV